MSDGMRVKIQVIGGDERAGTGSLMAWLRTETPELRPHAVVRPVMIEADAMPVPTGHEMVIVSLESASIAGAFASALTAFLRVKDDITLEVTTGTGQRSVLRSGDTVEQVARVIEPLVTTETGGWGADMEFAASNTDPESRRLPSFGGYGGAVGSAEGDGSAEQVSTSIDRLTMPVTIYLSETVTHVQVESAVKALLEAADLQIEDREEPFIGSWFRRMKAVAYRVRRSPAAREAALVAAHAADTRVTLAQDAVVTATLLQNLGPVIASLQPTKDAVLRIGALLIVKVDWAVNVFQLTAAQQALLDHRPQLASSPHEIIAALDLTPSSEESKPQALH